jgi:hypothetical protein
MSQETKTGYDFSNALYNTFSTIASDVEQAIECGGEVVTRGSLSAGLAEIVSDQINLIQSYGNDDEASKEWRKLSFDERYAIALKEAKQF